MTLEIGTTVIRKDEDREVAFTIENEKQLSYHQSLQDKFEYHAVNQIDINADKARAMADFDLPEVEVSKASAPRVHISDEICISCSS